MAQYRCSIRPAVSRGKGQSVVAKAAYNAREQLDNERHGVKTANYGRGGRDEVLFSGIFVDPKCNAPTWVQDRNALWNAAANAERHKNAREGQEIILNLPHELTQQQREFMLKDFVREHITRGTGRIADVNMHMAPATGDDRNVHAHILMTVREFGPKGFGKKLPEVDKAQIETWKQKWAERGAKELRKAGFEIEADRWAFGHLSQDKQRDEALRRNDLEFARTKDQEATKHRGPEATAIDRKAEQDGRGELSERGKVARQNYAAQLEMAKLKRELTEVQREIRAVIREQERSEGIADQSKGKKPEAIRFGDRLLNHAVSTALNDPRQQHGQPVGFAPAFKDALEKNRLALAKVTPDEAAKSYRERQFAKQLDRTSPVYKPGEIVVVQAPGNNATTDPRVYRLDQMRAEDYLRCLAADKNQLPSVGDTKRSMQLGAFYARQKWTQRGGMYQQQMWALRRTKESGRRQDSERAVKQKQDDYAEKQRREGDQIDPDRYRSDPEYRRQAQQAQAYKSPEEKKRDRENDMRAHIEQRGGRER